MRLLSDSEMRLHEENLSVDGFTVVEAFLDEPETDRISEALKPWQRAASFGDKFSGEKTRRVWSLLGKIRQLDEILLNENLNRLICSQIGPSVQLSSASTMEIFPGEAEQELHQDDGFFRIQRPHEPLVLNAIVALTEFTAENGATRLVPGSHLFAGPVEATDTVPAEMNRGSILLFNGALWHGAGANTSEDVRLGLALNSCRGWLRSQENHYLSIDPQVVRALPRRLQSLLGYDVYSGLGYADKRHPHEVLDTLLPYQ